MTFMETSASPATGFLPATPREILDSLLDPHLLLSPVRSTTGKIKDFRINDANLAAAEYYRLARESILGRRLLEFLPSDGASALLAMARDAYESGEPLVVNNYPFALEIYGQESRFDIRAVPSSGNDDLRIVTF